MELEIIGGLNLFSFQPDNLAAYSDPDSTTKEFQPYPFIIGSIGIKNDISETVAYNIRLSRDNILRNSLEGKLSARTDNLAFEFGPFIGLTNELEKPFIGVLGSIELTYPATLFLSLSGSATLGSNFDFTNDHTRETASLKIGFWMPFMIPSFTASYKNFTRYISEDHYIQDSLTRLQASIDFHVKNFSGVVRLDVGYQIYKRHYNEVTKDEFTDELDGYFFGGEITWQLRNKTKIIVGAEFPINMNTVEPMTTPLLFTMPKITAGFVYTLK